MSHSALSRPARSRPITSRLTISRLASAAGVGVETVRYYQRRGLMRTPQTPADAASGRTRTYDEEDVRRLRFIRSAQGAGFTLAEIAELLELDSGRDAPRARALAEGRIDAIDKQIATLTQARESLRQLARRCAGGKDRACPILEAFEPSGR